MLSNGKLTLEYNVRDAQIADFVLKKLGSFPSSIWFGVEKELKQLAIDRASDISSQTVSPFTRRWRKSARERSQLVETYTGAWKEVNDSSVVGDRTGTFVSDYKNSEEPGVTMEVGTHLGPSVVGNGSFSYKINAEEFAHMYPLIFQDYLIEKGIIPGDGFLALDEGREDQLFASLKEAAWANMKSEFGATGGAMALGNKLIINVKKLVGRFFRKG